MSNTDYIEHDENALEAYLSLLIFLKVPALQSKELAWDTLKNKLEHQIKARRQRSLVYWSLSAAAGIIMILGLINLYPGKQTVCSCPAGQMTIILLPDSSQVTLNAASSIHYQQKRWNHHRLVYLEGEAFFRVKKGSKFEVITSSGNISVLGTTFNVFARGSQLKVFCETGKVAVQTGNTVLLTPGMAVQNMQGKPLHALHVENDHESSWRYGEFWFRNAPLEEVVAAIERQYNVRITYQKAENRYYSGYFNTRSLEKTLKGVFGPMELKYAFSYNK